MIYCCDDRRRLGLVAAHQTLNGIEFLEIVDDDDPLRERTLLVHCLKPPRNFKRTNVRVDGGDRIQTVDVEWVAAASPLPAALAGSAEAATAAAIAALPDASKVLIVRVAQPGDFSTYTLRVVASEIDDSRHPDFDPLLCEIAFRFKAATAPDFDCRNEPDVITGIAPAADINYLARDYATLRRMLLDRMEQLAPQWKRAAAADYGMALVELLAYVGDQLSYQQDAIATEAYIETARRRSSLRRHAILADYPVQDGRNSRTWLQLDVSVDAMALDNSAHFLTRCPGSPAVFAVGSPAEGKALLAKPLVFAPLHRPTLRKQHNRMSFYTWGDASCCLPAGATRATLATHLELLRVNDPILLEEVRDPQTGLPQDADPSKRHIVRLTKVETTSDPLNGAPITEIAWSAAEALPFSLVISTVTASNHDATAVGDVSVASGNLVLVDHGETVDDEQLSEVPWPSLARRNASAPAPTVRYRPQLRRGPITHAASSALSLLAHRQGGRTAPNADISTGEAAGGAAAQVGPQVVLESRLGNEVRYWTPVHSLLDSHSGATHFVVELENDGGAWLRFGNGKHGLRPEPGTQFRATYRVGNGSAGNLGRDSVAHLSCAHDDVAKIVGIRQPLAASGGLDAESSETIRRNISEATRPLERAVTVNDYAAIAQRSTQTRRATAALRWTGSWHTVFITADLNTDGEKTEKAQQLLSYLDRYRMAGQDVKVSDPRYVPIELGLRILVAPDFSRGDIQRRLMQIFSDRILPDGSRAFFHPDNFAYGQSVFVSQIYAAIHALPGISSAMVVRFKRQYGEENPSENGRLILGRNEVAQLANDPNFPERGLLRIDITGGR